MSEKSFRKRSRQENERSITRAQNDFSAGMYNDVPKTSIPDNGVAYLKNFINYGDRLVGRSGSKEWGNYSTQVAAAPLPSFATGIASTSTTSGNYRTITISSGYSFDSTNEGDWFVHDDGTHERIYTINSPTEIITRTNSSADKTSTAAYLRGQVNGIYFHKFRKKIILHIRNDIYIARDTYISSWDLAYCDSYVKPSNEISTFDEMNDDIILFNTNGVYRIDISDHPASNVFYYKINSEVPSTRIADNSTGDYAYRYLYGLARITGSGANRDRQSSTSTLKTDSGTNFYDSNYIDYGTYYSSSPISSAAPQTVSGLSVPDITGIPTYKERHWTHFTIWRTADVGTNGIDPINGEGNNEEQYAWVADIPINKAFYGNAGGTTIDVISGEVSAYDIGSYINVFNGSDFTANLITDVDTVTNEYTVSTTIVSGGSGIPMHIGAEGAMSFSMVSGVITKVDGTDFINDDLRRHLTFTDGTCYHLNSFSGSSGVVVEDDTITLGVVAWGEGTRYFHDVLEDDELRPRLAGYPLYQRLFINLPSSDIGVVTNGMMFCSTRDDNKIYYSQSPDGFEHITGYYHPLYQLASVKDSIKAFGEFSDKLAVYCNNSVTTITTNIYNSVSIPNIGVEITVIAGQTISDASVGVIDYGSIASVGVDTQIMITSEPAIRIFDGYNFSDNIASQKIMNVLRSLRTNTSATFVPNIGYVFWGSDEQ